MDAKPTAEPLGPIACTSTCRTATVHRTKAVRNIAEMQRDLLLDFINIFLLFYFIRNIIEKVEKGKNSSVTSMIRSVSSDFQTNQGFDGKKNERQAGCIGLPADDIEQYTNGIAQQRYGVSVFFPEEEILECKHQ